MGDGAVRTSSGPAAKVRIVSEFHSLVANLPEYAAGRSLLLR
jgi:hypothetical protein